MLERGKAQGFLGVIHQSTSSNEKKGGTGDRTGMTGSSADQNPREKERKKNSEEGFSMKEKKRVDRTT